MMLSIKRRQRLMTLYRRCCSYHDVEFPIRCYDPVSSRNVYISKARVEVVTCEDDLVLIVREGLRVWEVWSLMSCRYSEQYIVDCLNTH